MTQTKTAPKAPPPAVPQQSPGPDLTGAIAVVEDLAQTYALAQLKAKGRLERAVMLARGIKAIRGALEPIMPEVMPLMNCRVGFLTDRDPQRSRSDKAVTPYTVGQVREALIEALLRGLYPVGNEFNIISGSCYTTKEGYERLVRELPGLTDLKVAPGVPHLREGGAVVRVGATWKLDGKAMVLEDEDGKPTPSIAVRLNAGMGTDAAIGKALRKAYARIYQRVTGTVHSDGAADEPPDLPVLATAAALPEPLPHPAQEALAPRRGNGQAPPPAYSLEHLAALSRELQMEEGELLGRLADYNATKPEQLTPEQVKEICIEMEDVLRRRQEQAREGE